MTPQPCGIYTISCLPTGQQYVGTSYQIKSRWGTHRSQLRRSKHTSKKLQALWNVHREENFHFQLIEECKKPKYPDWDYSQLVEREEFWQKELSAEISIIKPKEMKIRRSHPAREILMREWVQMAKDFSHAEYGDRWNEFKRQHPAVFTDRDLSWKRSIAS